MDEKNKRQHDRVKNGHYVKFCAEGDHPKWDTAPIKNISEGGILFYSTNYFEPGSQMNIVIYNPFIDPNKICKGNVIRCSEIEKGGGLFEVVVDITHLDEETKKALQKTIDFLKKKEGYGQR